MISVLMVKPAQKLGLCTNQSKPAEPITLPPLARTDELCDISQLQGYLQQFGTWKKKCRLPIVFDVEVLMQT